MKLLNKAALAAGLLAIAAFTGLCLAIIWLIFRTGWRIRS